VNTLIAYTQKLGFFPTGLLLQSIWTQTRSRRHARRFTSNKADGLCNAYGLSVCEEDKSKRCGQISTKFSE